MVGEACIASVTAIVTMRYAPTLDRIIAFLRVHLKFACCWPLSKTATSFQITVDRIFRFLSAVNGALVVVELTYSISNHLDDVFLIMQLACALGIFCEVPLQTCLFTLKYNQLQVRSDQLLLYIGYKSVMSDFSVETPSFSYKILIRKKC